MSETSEVRPGLSGAILVAPYVPPAPVVDPNWGRTRHLWTSWNGQQWDITASEGGVFLRREGLRGLGMPGFSHKRDSSPAVPGANYRETQYGVRSVFWPIHLFSDADSAGWIARDRAFWASMHPEHEGTWTVYTPDGANRSLSLRLESDGDWAPEADPTYFGWANYGINLQADQPFWTGEDISFSWDTVASSPFFGTSPSVLWISNNKTAASATVINPGDVEAYPRWVVRGPFATATVSVNGHALVIPFSMTTGQHLTIDTDPTNLTVVDHTGADRYDDMGALDWRGWINPGASAVLSLTLTGVTSDDSGIDMTLSPHYLRAW